MSKLVLPVSKFQLRTKGDIIIDRIISASDQALHTKSVRIFHPKKQRQKKQLQQQQQQQLGGVTHRTIQIKTCSNLDSEEVGTDINDNQLFPSLVRISVQPLLVLDLNGILCHRIRRRNDSEFTTGVNKHAIRYRPQLGPNIAQTPIIPRPDVFKFLEFLDQHFCLAIWTSAKAKTAKLLVELLIPPPIKDRLLFVWAQDMCHVETAPTSSNEIALSEILFQKHLDLVWNAFPLWNHRNTLLIDDSPDKCIRWKENAIHPPPLHGRIQRLQIPDDTSKPNQLSDEENVQKQMDFFQALSEHWISNYLVQTWDSRLDDDLPDTANDANKMVSFLSQRADQHMSWQSST